MFSLNSYAKYGFNIERLKAETFKLNKSNTLNFTAFKYSKRTKPNYKKQLSFLSNYYQFINDSSVIKKTKKLNHIISFDYGYGTLPIDGLVNVNYYGELNIHYRFRYKMLMTDVNYGISPFTNLGYFPKYYLLAGLTSDVTKLVSVHVLLGFGISYYQRQAIAFSGTEVNFDISGTLLKTGFFINPFKKQNIMFGYDASVIQHHYNNGSRQTGGGPILYSNISLNYVLNHGK